MNNLLAGMVVAVAFTWSISCLFFQGIESEIKTKTDIVEAGQKSSSLFAQHQAIVAQKDLKEIQKNQTKEDVGKVNGVLEK